MSLKITGRVREKESGLGLPGLVVKALDRDLLYDDLLGDTITDDEGKFEIIYEEDDFRDLFEKAPDLYIVVRTSDRSRVLYTSEESVRCEAGAEEHFEIVIPKATLGGVMSKLKNFYAKGIMRSNPDFKIDANIEPIGFDISASGLVEGTVSAISATVDEIPIRLTIPFLKGRRRPQIVASIGGFKIRLEPFGVKLESESVRLRGVFGTEGIVGKLNTAVACKTEMEVTGHFSGKIDKLEPDSSDDKSG